MASFLDLYGFIAVLFRAATLALGSIVIGGVVFTLLVNRRQPLTPAGSRLLATASFALALTDCLCLTANAIVLGGTTGLTLWKVVGADFFGCGCLNLLAATTLGFVALCGRETCWLSLVCAALLLTAEVGTSHAAARLSDQVFLLLLTAIHQGATAAWIGGLPYLVLSLRAPGSDPEIPRNCTPVFSPFLVECCSSLSRRCRAFLFLRRLSRCRLRNQLRSDGLCQGRPVPRGARTRRDQFPHHR